MPNAGTMFIPSGTDDKDIRTKLNTRGFPLVGDDWKRLNI
jgi:hypothetical protein